MESRSVYLKPAINPSTGKAYMLVHPFDSYYDLDNNLTPIYVYETDEKGNVLKDATGRPINKKVPFIKDGRQNGTEDKLFQVYVPKNSHQELVLPRDQHIYDQLIRCPHNEDTQFIDGKSTIAHRKKFRIIDPLIEERKEIEKLRITEEAYYHVMSCTDLQFKVFATFLGIGGVMTKIQLKMKMQTFAQTHPEKYHDMILANANLRDDLLFSELTAKQIIKLSSSQSYEFVNEDKRAHVLGSTKAKVIEYLNGSPTLREELIKRVAIDKIFKNYNFDSPPTPPSDDEETQQRVLELESENEMLRKQADFLFQQMEHLKNSVPLQSQSEVEDAHENGNAETHVKRPSGRPSKSV